MTSLEKGKLQAEHSDLKSQIKILEALMANDEDVQALIKKETIELRAKHAAPRRSEIVPEEKELSEIDLLANER